MTPSQAKIPMTYLFPTPKAMDKYRPVTLFEANQGPIATAFSLAGPGNPFFIDMATKICLELPLCNSHDGLCQCLHWYAFLLCPPGKFPGHEIMHIVNVTPGVMGVNVPSL
jgi:hypothetical protein